MQLKSLSFMILFCILSLCGLYCDIVSASKELITLFTTKSANEIREGDQEFQSQEQTARRLLLKTMSAMDKALDFCMREVASINFDAIMGTRMLEGQLGNVIKHIENGDYLKVTSDIKARIKALISKSEKVSETAVPYITARHLGNEFFPNRQAMIHKGLWENLDHPSRRTDPSLLNWDHVGAGTGKKDPNWSKCFMELLGHNKQCKKSQDCLDTLLDPGYTRYHLTHKVIYIELGEAAGCFTEKQLFQQYDLILQWSCAKILKEAEQLARSGFQGVDDQDLFIEQHTVCGMAGFEDFFRYDWLIYILQWQWPEGCYGEHRGEKPDPVPPPKTREKRDDRVLVGGCLSHKTSVVLSALPQYVRYIMDFLFRDPRGTLGFFNG